MYLKILLWLKSFRRELFHSQEPFVWKTQEKESVYIKNRSPFFGEYILSFWESIWPPAVIRWRGALFSGMSFALSRGWIKWIYKILTVFGNI